MNSNIHPIESKTRFTTSKQYLQIVKSGSQPRRMGNRVNPRLTPFNTFRDGSFRLNLNRE